ncbi:MAG TPA: hypothetical protein VIF09_01720 [Polyangiaceae bacterium]|jgi:hypothetical protein
MRALPLLLVLGGVVTCGVWAGVSHAQVSDAERAAARSLFQEGDALQRAGKFGEALDKFQRAQQVFSAPTNMLRIAECDAALGRLVESEEAYRAVVRTPLPAGSPPAFQSAVDQARAELAQVEPRVPKLVVQISPATAPSPQLQIDGQPVPAAILGEPFPLDPGTHRVLVTATGFSSTEQSVTLKEHEAKTLQIDLRAIPGVVAGPPPGPPVPPPRPVVVGPDGMTEVPAGTPPPPPPIGEAPAAPAGPRESRLGVILGLHLGMDLPSGQVRSPNGGDLSFSSVSAGGLAYALDGGLRFARQWYVGLTLEHAGLGAGNNPGAIGNGSGQVSSNTTAAGVVIGIIANPDRVSFYGELGVQGRWYDLTFTDVSGKHTASYAAGEALLGLGVWIPVGRSVRLLPEVTASLGAFGAPTLGGATPSSSTTSDSPGHGFVMLGLAGFYNLDL